MSLKAHISQVRYTAARIVARIIAGKNFVCFPYKVIYSIPELLLSLSERPYLRELQLIRNASVVQYPFDEDLPLGFRREREFPARYVYRLKDVFVGIRQGVCSIRNQVFLESIGHWDLLFHTPESHFQRDSKLSRDGPAICLVSTSYYHLLLEQLPRLLFTLRKYPSATVFTAAQSPPFVREILSMLVSAGHLTSPPEYVDGVRVLCSDYVMTANEVDSGFVHPDSLRILREILDPLGACDSEPSDFYISRRWCSRAFENELEIEEWATSQGYKVVYLERLSVREQIGLFRNARTIVANHGAGLANLVWAKNQTRVIELFSPRYFNDCFARLAVHAGMHYCPLWATITSKTVDSWGYIDVRNLAKVTFLS